MDRRALLGVSAHVTANLLVAVSTLLTPALLAPVLGLHDYAFIAFYLHLAVFLLLFDLGLSGLLLRQLAEFCGRRHKDKSTGTVGNLGRDVERIYWAIGLLLGIALFVAARPIAEHWLHVPPSSVDGATKILRFMSIAFIFNWPLFLYQNALIGLGQQFKAGILSGTAAVTRLAIGYAVASWTIDVTYYFGAIAICNLAIIGVAFVVYHRALARTGIFVSSNAVDGWAIADYRGYALQLALIMMLGYLLVSVDRLLAAKILPLSQYAEYSIVCTLSQGISLATSAVVGACLPRLVHAYATQDQRAYRETYFVGQLAVCVVCVPIYVAVAFFPGTLFELVAGHRAETNDIRHALVIHSSGTLAHTLMVLSFAAHQSQQQLRLWLVMASLLASGALGFAVAFKSEWGIVGLAYFWLAVCVMQMLIGTAISSKLRYHDLSFAGVSRLLTYSLQVIAGIGLGYLTSLAIDRYSFNPLLTMCATSAVSLLAVSSFTLIARRLFYWLYPQSVVN